MESLEGTLGETEQQLRKRMQVVIESPRAETATLLLVLVYGLVVLFDLGVQGLVIDGRMDGWKDAFTVIDVTFLSVFMIEVLMRLFVFGPRYFASFLNLVDASAIALSFVITILDMTGTLELGDDPSDDAPGELDEGEEAGKDAEFLKKVSMVVRFLRVGRLVSVMMRSMKTAQSMADRGSIDANGNPVADDENFCGSYRMTQEASMWSTTHEERVTVNADEAKLKALVAKAPAAVRVLTDDDFSTVLDCFRNLDKDNDGVIVHSELKPLLENVLKEDELGPQLAHAFDALDADSDGAISVAELYAARVCLQRLMLSDAEVLVAMEKEGALKQSRILQKAAFGELQVAIHARLRWWTYERWQDHGNVKLLRRLREDRVLNDKEESLLGIAKSPTRLWEKMRRFLSMKRYQFAPGPVDVVEHCNGSGAMLEARVDEIVKNLAEVQNEVGELSQKLQEIQVGQPIEAQRYSVSIATYSTFLQGLSTALPAACLRMTPFANYDSEVAGVSWYALRPKEGVNTNVRFAARVLSFGMTLTALLRVAFVLTVFAPAQGGFTNLELRRACEETWTPTFDNSTHAHESDSAVAYVLRLGTCSDDEGPLSIFSFSVAFPIVGCITLCFSPLMFWRNAESTALVRLLGEPRTLILMLQAVGKAGLDTITLTRFPVAVRLYSVPYTGGMMLSGRLFYCLFMPMSVILFIMMDICIVTAPRMRCVFAITLLVHMSCELALNQYIDLPSIAEAQADPASGLARNLDFALLTALAGAIASTLSDPKNMTFVKLGTDLNELVLFDTGLRRQKATLLAEERKASIHSSKLRSRHQEKRGSLTARHNSKTSLRREL